MIASAVQGERIKSVRAKLKDPSRESLESLVATTKWTPPRTHILSQELIKVRMGWAEDSVEDREQRECAPLYSVPARDFIHAVFRKDITMLCRRAYTTPAAPVSTALTPVRDKDASGSGNGPEPSEFSFWQDIPEGTKQQSTWWQFKGRVHLIPLARAWEMGIRCMPAPHGIPLVGLSDPQLKASR